MFDGDLTVGGDGPLVDRFKNSREQAAFAAIVRRHGRLVWSVCLRVLQHRHDAEDAFQATFLVLARRAHAIRKPDSLASWLHGVAYRLASKMKSDSSKRRQRDLQAPLPSQTEPVDLCRRELEAALDEELQALPDQQRQPVLLCYLEGLTQEQAATHLGWPRGTLKRRLESGRDTLRDRLTRRGLILAATAVATLSGKDLVAAAMPNALRANMAKAAVLFAEKSEIPVTLMKGHVVGLAEGVLRAMIVAKLRLVVAGFAICALLMGGVIALGPGMSSEQVVPKPRSAAPDPFKAAPRQQAEEKKEPTERDKALVKAAQEQYEGRWEEFITGKTTFDFLAPWSGNWLKAELKLCHTKAEKIAAFERHFQRTEKAEKINKARLDEDVIPRTQYHQALYLRLEAEIWLVEAKAKD
jgi:RNA polymerase sigma factor (sigma-70 family)